MPTVRQKKLAKVIIENANLDNGLNAGQMLEKVGYSKSVAKAKSADIIGSQGVKDALDDFGFSEDNAKKVVGEILLKADAQDKDRLKAADMVFDVHGSKAPQKHININTNVSIEHRERATNALRHLKG